MAERWTTDQDAKLVAMRIKGKSSEDISAAVGRSVDAVESRIYRLKKLGVDIPSISEVRESCEDYSKLEHKIYKVLYPVLIALAGLFVAGIVYGAIY